MWRRLQRLGCRFGCHSWYGVWLHTTMDSGEIRRAMGRRPVYIACNRCDVQFPPPPLPEEAS